MTRMRPNADFIKKLNDQVELDGLVGEEDENAKPLTLAQRRFLVAYKNLGTVSGASRESGTNRKTHYRWCHSSPTYRRSFIEAEEEARDEVLTKCRKVALEDENVPMLIHLSKGMFPELFGTQRHELSGPDGSPIRVQNETETVDEILDRIHGLMRQQDAAETSTPSPGLPRGRGDEFPDSEDTEG